MESMDSNHLGEFSNTSFVMFGLNGLNATNFDT